MQNFIESYIQHISIHSIGNVGISTFQNKMVDILLTDEIHHYCWNFLDGTFARNLNQDNIIIKRNAAE